MAHQPATRAQPAHTTTLHPSSAFTVIIHMHVRAVEAWLGVRGRVWPASAPVALRDDAGARGDRTADALDTLRPNGTPPGGSGSPADLQVAHALPMMSWLPVWRHTEHATART